MVYVSVLKNEVLAVSKNSCCEAWLEKKILFFLEISFDWTLVKNISSETMEFEK